MQSPSKVVLSAFFFTGVLAVGLNCQNSSDGTGTVAIAVAENDASQKVDIMIDQKLFTSYIFSDEISVLKKPVLYPLVTAGGNHITRGFPLEQRAGERVDHPHHIGHWLNYGDVNGLDFWNNSDAISGDRVNRMGTIRHQEIAGMRSGNGIGELEVVAHWQKPDGTPILREDTHFVFHADGNARTIDRTTRLTALGEDVTFKDNKEGFVAIRVTRALEHPSDEAVKVTDASGKATDVPVLDNTGVTGQYLSSEGVTATDVWSKRARWVVLRGTIQGEKVAVAILDHPENVGYPTYWHARGYGLFAANALGQEVFSEGAEKLNFSLPAGESATFKYRLYIISGESTAADIEAQFKAFSGSEDS